ncbi:hypothetical protein [uncultured Nonlabens sp.]|uniref:sensor histidine kinase n=1 Tax=uncultured Nonlabens sp. TaxID=859306 RepID=UPI002611A673|nr:hypothetical protein [uncultured Nonlabens sp.]
MNVITKGLKYKIWNNFKKTQKSTIYRVLQELLTSMRKHSKTSIVVLNFEQQNHQLLINYKDNGKGTDLIKRNGLQNTEDRIHSINGTITFNQG